MPWIGINKKISSLLLMGMAACLCSIPAMASGTQPFTVVIDAGHGGEDPGCHGDRYKEKDVALGISLKLGKLIEENCKDVKVVYTRKTDVFVELNERASIANNNRADLFICIHCNASTNRKVYGSETYVMGLHKSKGNLDVAKRENAAILLEENYQKNYDNFDPNSDEANIIFTMYQNAFLEQSLSLASKIQYYYNEKACRMNKGVKQAGFLVLWKTSMPSLLTETGFLTHPEEEKFLGSEKGQNYMALSLFLAFRKYKDEVKQAHVLPADSLESKPGCKENPMAGASSITEESEETAELPKDKTETDRDHTKEKTDEPAGYFSVQFYSTPLHVTAKPAALKGFKADVVLNIGKSRKYFSGQFATFEEAMQHQKKLRKKGFKDAFVAGIKGKERIPAGELLEEQKRAAGKP
jgi:N-acetylmuramoyl-L-alanine amidase